MERLPLVRALTLYRQESPSPASRAASALYRLLDGVFASPRQEAAWKFSRLTGDGYPVELSFTSSGEAIRYAAEVSGAESHPNSRLERALAVVKELVLKENIPIPQDFLSLADRMRQIQSVGELDYGAWVSGRHAPEGDAFKLYAEVPKGDFTTADDWARHVFGHRPLLTERNPTLRMIGLEPAAGRVEFYFRACNLQSWEVHRLMGRIGLAHQAEPLLELVENISEKPASPRLPCTQSGFSLAAAPDGRSPVFSWFCPARNLIGGDGRIRRRLLGAARRYGWPLRHYEAISAPLDGSEGPRTRHGLVSFVAAPGMPPQLGIGLRPP